ncbi:MAG: hypothetical protein HC871_02795 [Rhizobiales bacterium]|nr:hypothetical protein [Hyphomicrobiales bacterium]
MPRIQDSIIRQYGTRVRLFGQSHHIDGFEEPEVVWLSPPAGSVGPGPSDDRMYVVDPIGKAPYEFPYLPPYLGPAHAPVLPDAEGHFDHLEVNTRDFIAAHMYGGIRRTLDIWEGYFGRRIDWQFQRRFERLELVPLLDWDNAQAGFGFIETGFGPSQAGEDQLFGLNFDVLAHELGHAIVFAEVGHDEATVTGEYLGFQEAMGDIMALISAMHFDSVLDRTLASSQGNLYTLNESNRIGELSNVAQVRTASNSRKLSEFAEGWSDPHFLAQPLVGAIFDSLVDVYQDRLLQWRLIDPELRRLSEVTAHEELDEGTVQERFAQAYDGRHERFRHALIEARDHIGDCLVFMLTRTSPHFLRYADVGESWIAADRWLSGGRHAEDFRENFRWRDIGRTVVGPRLETAESGEEGHGH